MSKLLTLEEILDDFAREIKGLERLSARAEYMAARKKAVGKLTKAQLTKQHKDRSELMERAKEIVLEIRQYLINTEFAPEPFKKPVDADKLTIEFPKQIIALFPDKAEIEKQERERIVGLYTLHHETQSPKDMRRIMLEVGKP